MLTSSRYRSALTLVLAGLLILAACAPSRPRSIATFTGLAKLTPYRSPTSSLTPRASSLPTGSPPPLPTFTPSVTPTPFMHVLTNDDTLFGLALKYGVSLAAIETANPELNPNFLSVGKSVIIPIQATPAPTQAPTPTPVPVRLGAPACYPTADGGLWCFALAANDQPFGLENLSAWISLDNSNGQILAGQAAILPLNRLPPGATLPLAAFFPPPAPAGAVPSVEQTNSLVIPAGDARYLTATVLVNAVDILPGGLQANVQGDVSLPATTRPASVVWVAVTAYDTSGQVVGMRKWEAAEPLQPGARLPFTVTVYSLGPAIARVEALVEARP